MSVRSFLLKMYLKTRVTVFTLLVFMLILWALTFYVGHMLRLDLERLLGQQQFSTVSIVAADVEHEVSDRLRALQATASKLPIKTMASPGELEKYLQSRDVFQSLFNGGSFIAGLDGVVLASTGGSFARKGLNLSVQDYMVAALRDAQASVGGGSA